MSTQQPVIVIATFVPAEGHEQDVERILRGMVAPSRAEEGCRTYDLYRTEDGFTLFEHYVSSAALDHHRGTEHYVAYRAAIAEHLSRDIGVSRLSEVDVAG